MTTTTRTLTIDDLMRLGSDARVEVQNGELIEMTPVGGLHSLIAKNILQRLDTHVQAQRSGIVFTDGFLYVLSITEEGVRKARVPDVSFVRKADIPADWDIEQPFPGAPTLAVEVMSPDDLFEDVVQKVHEYFEAGTQEVWVVLPRQQSLYRYHQRGSQVAVYHSTDTLDVGELFPGLSLPLAEIFVLPDLG